MPFQYRVHRVPLVTIPQGQIGYVFARDGIPLPATQILASNETASDFQDVRAFLQNGGSKGPQRKILREGSYAINLAPFIVLTMGRRYASSLEANDEALFEQMSGIIAQRHGFEPVVIKDADDVIGIITVHDGPALPEGEIIALTVGQDANRATLFHNNFQDPKNFYEQPAFAAVSIRCWWTAAII